jgi:hypothetical protein
MSAMFYWFFAAAIATQMQRIEGEHHPLTRIESKRCEFDPL